MKNLRLMTSGFRHLRRMALSAEVPLRTEKAGPVDGGGSCCFKITNCDLKAGSGTASEVGLPLMNEWFSKPSSCFRIRTASTIPS